MTVITRRCEEPSYNKEIGKFFLKSEKEYSKLYQNQRKKIENLEILANTLKNINQYPKKQVKVVKGKFTRKQLEKSSLLLKPLETILKVSN